MLDSSGTPAESVRPPSPPDEEDRKIIRRVAEFVAKNGLEFEERTREKQYGNPRFSFLFGGRNADYYRYRVFQEAQKLNEVGIEPGPVVSNHETRVPQQSTDFDVNAALSQIASINQQITDSETNLHAHYSSIELQKEAQLVTAIEKAEAQKIATICEQVALDVEPLSKLLDQLNGHCSKDVISNSKKWIFDKCTTDRLREAILMYLLHRVKETRASEQFKLHILYLINDWAHHCQRKKLDTIRQMLSRYVPQLYAFTFHGVTDSAVIEKLEKLIGVWEGHKYFDDSCYKQLRNPLLLYQNWKNAQQAEYAKTAHEIHAQLLAIYKGYEQQHQEFAMHCRAQIARLQQEIEANRLRKMLPNTIQPEGGATQPPMNRRERRSRFDQKAVTEPESNFAPPDNDYGRFFAAPPPKSSSIQPAKDTIYHAAPDEPDDPSYIVYDEEDFANNEEKSSQAIAKEIPETQRPPPFISTPQLPPAGPVRNLFPDSALIPNCPYYDLPAGMMMPLIEIDDFLYKPVPVGKLRLPPPIPPTERLLRAVDAFYGPPTLDSPRDLEGWERTGLFDYYTKKNELRRLLEMKLKAEGKTFEQAIENVYDVESEEEADHKESRRNSRKGRRESSSSDNSSSSSSETSKSSIRDPRGQRSVSSSSSSSNSSSKSPPDSRERHSRSKHSPEHHGRSRSRSASPEARASFIEKGRSPTPPFIPPSGPPPRLSASSKGAQLLARMGWQGGGLGAERQGIEEPISGGEVRDTTDQYRGVGSKPDMFEEYRKQMSGYHRSRNRRFD